MTDPRQIQLIMELRGQGISDARVLGAIERTPRDVFVDAPFEAAAYDNSALPIACGQTISQPFVVAYMTQRLDVGPQMRVLEIGAGSGYQAAVLSPLCRRVYTIERHKPLLQQAQKRFKALKLDNVATKLGDGFQGWPEQAPFDRILLSCAVEAVPPILIEQLKPGGILIAPVGSVPKSDGFGLPESFSQRLTKMIRNETGVTEEVLIPVVFVPMLPGLP
ncbi:MAG TPA: protein-L-isoaspartate(D-aspartate) O-methyltransferase [Rhizomicrobium sp.]|nr:protein-L-isoaspartate(D-aspartate) O-methyltransferase [Rhizomicrobium sp.]